MILDKIHTLFFAIPLIIAFSLVYQGTRSEKLSLIITRSIRTMFSLVVLMTVLLIVLQMML